MGARIVQPPGRGPYVFRIHGQIYHRSGNLHPAAGEQPSYGQLYILEGNEAVQQRMEHAENQPCQPVMMQELQEAILEVSPYARAYKHMQQIEQEETARNGGNIERASTVQMVMRRGPDQRRFNEASHDEVAAIFVGSDGAPPIDRDITVYPRDHPMQKLSFMSSNCDPMTYPLLFARDDLGWVEGTKHSEEHQTRVRNTVTVLQFYSYRLAIRDAFSPIHAAGKLFQQYVVDTYVKTEAMRLQFDAYRINYASKCIRD